jgi:molybdopterin-containing oxidoreductase family membrane subunit
MDHQLAFNWPILIYFFLSGTSGGAFICASIMTLFVEKTEKITKITFYEAVTSLVCLGLGAIFLLLDLGQPLRGLFLIAIPLLNPFSPLSWGTVLILGNSILLIAYLYSISKNKEQLSKRLSFIGMFFAAGLVCYTGFLLSVSNSPLWQSAILVPLFFASGCIAGLSLIFILNFVFKILSKDDLVLQNLRKILLIMIIVDGAILTDYYIVYSAIIKEYASAQLILFGQFAFTFWVGEVILGIILPFVLLLSNFGKTVKGLAVTGLFAMIGVFIMRYIIVFAGQAV